MVVGEQASQKGTLHSPTAIHHRSGCTGDCYCSSLIIDGGIEWSLRRLPVIWRLLNKLIPRLQVCHTPSLLPRQIFLYLPVRCAGALYFFVLLTTCFHLTTPRTWQSQLPIPVCSAFANTSSPATVQFCHSHAYPSSQQSAPHTSLDA